MEKKGGHFPSVTYSDRRLNQSENRSTVTTLVAVVS